LRVAFTTALEGFDLEWWIIWEIVVNNANEKCPSVFPGIGQRLHWSFEDPIAFTGTESDNLNKFRQVRDQIDEQIQNWLQVHTQDN